MSCHHAFLRSAHFCSLLRSTTTSFAKNASFINAANWHLRLNCSSQQKRFIFNRIINAFSKERYSEKGTASAASEASCSSSNTAPKPSAASRLRPQAASIDTRRIQNIIAVASGKGGVGKSTVACNLALAMAHKHGMRVGVLDADVYGPSMHKMFNLEEDSAQVDPETNKLEPLTNYGIKCMSMGILTKSEEAAIWRGPMVMGAIRQMLTQVDWGDLDLLIIDMPPGTGDAQLTLTQDVQLTGAVIVSTPQDIALIDVVRGINMFRQVNVPIVGIVENMSYFQCEDCKRLGKKRYIFGKSGAKNKAQEMGIPFLGEIPIEEDLPLSGDQGKPVVVLNKDSSASKCFFSLSDHVHAFLSGDEGTEYEPSQKSERTKAPKIVFEE
eukprot:CAMPEP_0117444588 /NCGR_PEP_ID=MMETSP0759-20121206/5321_1 /TAXON_ID=63605 /ORGANISM="Percolomonas cosmopolitus, Strain WS" /LENGTH=382 /DNA_ID=CAMNT_0005236665 /DNA_START=42 /DNA_END=1190 /DNA_ORIENTATION=+